MPVDNDAVDFVCAAGAGRDLPTVGEYDVEIYCEGRVDRHDRDTFTVVASGRCRLTGSAEVSADGAVVVRVGTGLLRLTMEDHEPLPLVGTASVLVDVPLTVWPTGV